MKVDLDQIDHLTLFNISGTPVTVGGLVAALVIVAIGLIASRLVSRGLRGLRNRSPRGAPAIYILEKLSTYGLIVFALLAGLSTLGINLSSLAVFAGALGVGVGLGLQGVVKEFVSGLVLIFGEELRVGDYVELESGQRGVIHEIGARATRIRNNDSVDILIPNSHLIEGTVTNWTLKGFTRRIHVPFGVAYGADKEKVREAVLSAAQSVPFTLPEDDQHRTQVWLTGFGDSSLNFELVVWPTLEAVKRPNAMQAAYNWAIDDALRAAGIEIPFPQRDIRIRGLFGREGDSALTALRLDTHDGAHKPTDAAAPSRNDAAEELGRGPRDDIMPPPPGKS